MESRGPRYDSDIVHALIAMAVGCIEERTDLDHIVKVLSQILIEPLNQPALIGHENAGIDLSLQVHISRRQDPICYRSRLFIFP